MPTDAMVNEYNTLTDTVIRLIRQQNSTRSFVAYARLARAITRADARLARLEPLVLPYLPTDAPSASQTF
jgi:hypothetical protein